MRHRLAAAWLGVAIATWIGAAAPPARAQGETTHFVVVGHLRGDRTGESWPWLDVLVRDVSRLHPDAVFLTGDLVWGDYTTSPVDAAAIEADWARLDAALAAIGAPIYRVPGNHDANDPVTRAIFDRRYGPLPRAVRIGPDLALLVDSTISTDQQPPPLPRPHTRPDALAPERVAALREALDAAGTYRHGFAFVHHVLWWERDAPWWRDVHPLLRDAGFRAVFAGDFGPMKLSYEARDGIEYWQSSVEGETGEELLRRLDGARLLHVQLDTFLEVRADDAGATVTVHPVALRESGRLTPAHHRAITSPPSLSVRERIERALGGPGRRLALAAVVLGAFAGGIGVGIGLARRRRRA